MRSVRNHLDVDPKAKLFILGPSFTPSGVVRIANLQAREQYAYIKP
jgi:intracellular sulfur oxidation DsrE/DsrF family protein